MREPVVVIDYYTDLLCVWAYVAQVRVDELQREFGSRVDLRYHFISLFGDTPQRFGAHKAGGFDDYADHVQKVVAGFDHVQLHPDVWRRVRPCSSLPAHLVLEAVRLLEDQPPQSVPDLAWRLRCAFFRDGEDISRQAVLRRHVEAAGLPYAAIAERIDNGMAFCLLARDMNEQRERGIEGSPTFLMNEGRQKLYGNLGYEAIAANVRELLTRHSDLPAWC
ncbi:MAG: hypothetical protein RLZ44_1492 [Pseudomonadota bacterium]